MKRVILAATLISLIFIVFPALATNVSISGVTADLSFSKDYGGVVAGNTLTINLNLPFTLEQINSTGGADYLNITADAATTSTTVNVTVNGVSVLTNYVITGGSTKQVTFADFAVAGVDMSATKLTIVVEAVANSTTSTLLVMNANDAAMTANWSYTVKESRITTPKVVKFGEGQSFYTVKDTVTITQNSDVNITDVIATFTYPSNALSTDVDSYNFGSLNTSESKSKVLAYQKKGPVVSAIKSTEKNGVVNVTMTIYAYEPVLAEFTFDPTDKIWSKYFPDFDPNNIEKITLNDVSVSYSISGNEISMDLDLVSGNNELTIVYAKSIVTIAEVTPTPAKQWYEVPTNQLLMVLAIVVVVAFIAASRKRW